MSSCINCGAEFVQHERRGTVHRYIGYYCEDCHDYQKEHGELPEV